MFSIRPGLWEEIQHIVEWMQRRDLPQRFKSPALMELPAALQRQVDDYLANALKDQADLVTVSSAPGFIASCLGVISIVKADRA